MRNLAAVVPEKNNIRLCIEIRYAVKVAICVKHPFPNIDEILIRVQGSMCFSKLHLKSGFHQLESSLASHSIAIFPTKKRKKRYKTLTFAIYSPQEKLHYTLREVFPGTKRAENIAYF